MPKSHQHHSETVEMFFRLNTNTGEAKQRKNVLLQAPPTRKRREDENFSLLHLSRKQFFVEIFSNLSNKYNFLSPYTLSTKIISKSLWKLSHAANSKIFHSEIFFIFSQHFLLLEFSLDFYFFFFLFTRLFRQRIHKNFDSVEPFNFHSIFHNYYQFCKIFLVFIVLRRAQQTSWVIGPSLDDWRGFFSIVVSEPGKTSESGTGHFCCSRSQQTMKKHIARVCVCVCLEARKVRAKSSWKRNARKDLWDILECGYVCWLRAVSLNGELAMDFERSIKTNIEPHRSIVIEHL